MRFFTPALELLAVLLKGGVTSSKLLRPAAINASRLSLFALTSSPRHHLTPTTLATVGLG